MPIPPTKRLMIKLDKGDVDRIGPMQGIELVEEDDVMRRR
jgi:hypothetical protein